MKLLELGQRANFRPQCANDAKPNKKFTTNVNLGLCISAMGIFMPAKLRAVMVSTEPGSELC